MGISFISFGFVGAIQSKTLYVALSMSARLLQGLASVCIQVTCYSIATNFFPKSKMKLIGFIEAAMGLGMISGPFLGTILYQLVGYNGMLITFGSTFIALTLLMPILLPPFIDKKTNSNHLESSLSRNSFSNLSDR